MKIRLSLPLVVFLLPIISACATAPAVVVENHTLSLVVDDPAASLEQFRTIADSTDGFIEDSSVSFSAFEVPGGTVYQATFTMRVPVHYLQQTLTRMKDGGIDVGYYYFSRQDFTLEHDILRSRRAELEQSRDDLLNLIDEKYAQPSDTILANDLLHGLESELHSVESRMQHLEDESSLPYIYVELVPIEVRRLTVPGS